MKKADSQTDVAGGMPRDIVERTFAFVIDARCAPSGFLILHF